MVWREEGGGEEKGGRGENERKKEKSEVTMKKRCWREGG